MRQRTLALLCSVRCPGDVILGVYDLALALRQARIAVIGGFHSPMERECLRLLLRGTQPVIICPARGIARLRVPPEWREPLAQGRLLVVSPFAATERRATRELAAARNAFVAALAAVVMIAHATPGGTLEALGRDCVMGHTPLVTLVSDHNANLVAAGAQAVRPEAVDEWWPKVAR